MGKFVDLTGQQFNRWKVIKYSGDSQWLCECQCENHTLQLLNGYTLKSGKSKGCRKCMHKNGSDQIKDISEQTFGELTAIEYNKETARWKCLCSCGAYTEVRQYDLIHGSTKSCGDRKKHPYRPSNFTNLVNRQFGDYIVVKYDGYDSDKEKAYWICRCKCGEVERLSTQTLKYNRKCNHNIKKYVDITDRRFGKLTAIKKADNGKWLCRCDCTNLKLVYTSNLINGGTTTCGCSIQTKLDSKDCIEMIESFMNKYNCKPSRLELEELFGVSKATVRKYIERFGLEKYIDNKFRSRQERYIAKYLIEHSIDIRTNVRNLIEGKELDIYIPDRKIAIEFNGNYWHSELYKDKYYHQNKSLECLRSGIEVIHIFEYDFDNIDNILTSILDNSYSNKIYINGVESRLKDIGNTAVIESPLYMSTIKELTKLGFEAIEILEPKYKWINNKYDKVSDTVDSDDEMYDKGYCKIYDAGRIKMMLKQ